MYVVITNSLIVSPSPSVESITNNIQITLKSSYPQHEYTDIDGLQCCKFVLLSLSSSFAFYMLMLNIVWWFILVVLMFSGIILIVLSSYFEHLSVLYFSIVVYWELAIYKFVLLLLSSSFAFYMLMFNIVASFIFVLPFCWVLYFIFIIISPYFKHVSFLYFSIVRVFIVFIALNIFLYYCHDCAGLMHVFFLFSKMVTISSIGNLQCICSLYFRHWTSYLWFYLGRHSCFIFIIFQCYELPPMFIVCSTFAIFFFCLLYIYVNVQYSFIIRLHRSILSGIIFIIISRYFKHVSFLYFSILRVLSSSLPCTFFSI